MSTFTGTLAADKLRIEDVESKFWIELSLTPSQPSAPCEWVTIPRDQIQCSCTNHGISCSFFEQDKVFVFQCDGKPSPSFWIECCMQT